jgi:hypothetical protein
MLRPALRSAVIAAAIIAGGCGGPEPSGSPTGGPEIACVGVPQAQCDEAVAELEGPFSAPLVEIQITCLIAACTPTDGQLRVDVLLANGQRESSGYAYGSGQQGPAPVEPPALAVVPICLGLPFAMCRQMAETAAGSVIPADLRPRIARITVRCIGVCTPTKGEGETRIDFVDGTNMVSGWGYQTGSSPPVLPAQSGTIASESP